MTKWDLQQFVGVPKGLAELVRLFIECVCEAFGTFIIVFFGCGSVLSPALSENDVVQISLAFGLAVAVGVQINGPISGGYLNPAVTLAGLVAGRLSLIRSMLFVIFQIIGGIAGALTLHMFTPHHYIKTRNLGMNALFSKESTEACLALNQTVSENVTCIDTDFSVTPFQGFVMEHLVTMVFILLVLHITEPDPESHWSPALMIGLTVSLCHLLLVPYTGCSVNPARSLGPAVVQGNFKDQWVFWIGPLSGGLVAGINHVIVLKILSKTEYNVTKPESIKKNQIALEEADSLQM